MDAGVLDEKAMRYAKSTFCKCDSAAFPVSLTRISGNRPLDTGWALGPGEEGG
jgi:hypothetical protein